jgi:hypothetical protein
MHIGELMTFRRVVSKWGAFPVYEHENWELPARYGDQARPFNKPNDAGAISLFFQYARVAEIAESEITNAAALLPRN